jgi:hypothetical protein
LNSATLRCPLGAARSAMTAWISANTASAQCTLAGADSAVWPAASEASVPASSSAGDPMGDMSVATIPATSPSSRPRRNSGMRTTR